MSLKICVARLLCGNALLLLIPCFHYSCQLTIESFIFFHNFLQISIADLVEGAEGLIYFKQG